MSHPSSPTAEAPTALDHSPQKSAKEDPSLSRSHTQTPEPSSSGAAKKTTDSPPPQTPHDTEGKTAGLSDEERERAVRTLQRRWRARNGSTDVNARWHEMDIQMRYKVRLI